tara:strand:+ start:444 stop:863 length:420 start_codon:yes stop_codon:yes gene_type:complete
MSEQSETPIFADPEPEEPKRKKRRPRKKKEDKKEEENTQQEQTQESVTQEKINEQDILDELGVNVNYQFLMTIRDILVNITPRVNWNSNELIPVGMVIRDLNNISANVNEQLSQKNNEEEEEEDEEDLADVDETSEAIN